MEATEVCLTEEAQGRRELLPGDDETP